MWDDQVITNRSSDLNTYGLYYKIENQYRIHGM